MEEFERLFERWPPEVQAYLGDAQDLQAVEERLLAAPSTIKWAALKAHPRLGKPTHLVSHHEQRNLNSSIYQDCERYEQHFGFPFVTFVNGRGTEEILRELNLRMGNGKEEEEMFAIGQLCAIARHRAKLY